MVYTKKLITAPATEVVTLTEAKAQCRITHDAEDGLVEDLIVPAARQRAELYLNRQLITATWDIYLDEFPCEREIKLPLGQLQSVSTFEFTDASDTTTSWSISSSNLVYSGVTQAHISTADEPAIIRLAYSQQWPNGPLKTLNPVRIRIVCGYGDDADSVPTSIKEALLLDIGHLYKHRESIIVGKSVAIAAMPMPMGYEWTLDNYRLFSFG